MRAQRTGSSHGTRNATSSAVARTVSVTEKMSAIHFARACVAPPMRMRRNPANGTMSKSERMNDILWPAERPRDQANEQNQEDGDDANDIDPGVALDASGLLRSQEDARSNRLEAEAVDRAINHVSVKPIRDMGRGDGPAAETIRSSVDDMAVKPINDTREPRDRARSEGLVVIF